MVSYWNHLLARCLSSTKYITLAVNTSCLKETQARAFVGESYNSALPQIPTCDPSFSSHKHMLIKGEVLSHIGLVTGGLVLLCEMICCILEKDTKVSPAEMQLL